MKKAIVTVLLTAFAFNAFAQPETPKEKSLELIVDKTMSLVMLVEARLKNLLKEIKTGKSLSEEEISDNWDRIVLMKILYKERKLDILKAYYQHYRTFGRGEVMSKEEVRLVRKAKEYQARVDDFWLDVKMVRSQMRVLHVTTSKFDVIEPITELGPSLAKQVIREYKIEDDELLDD